MDRTKKIKDIRTEVIDGEFVTVYYYTDGTVEYKVQSDKKINKLISQIMSSNDDEEADSAVFQVLKGGRK